MRPFHVMVLEKPSVNMEVIDEIFSCQGIGKTKGRGIRVLDQPRKKEYNIRLNRETINRNGFGKVHKK